MFIETTEDNLQEILNQNQKVLVQFGAAWCGNCRLMKPKVKRLAEADSNVQFVYVDADKFPESRKLAKVTNLPTFAIYENGNILNQVVSSKEEHLKDIYNEIAGI
ncbi:MAG: thioredoxin family protein [Weeksellaceae bacterium]|jgi:thiol-disulfide isomerase/thioredoxin|nr:thioredoxin family protein [Weeksellaceae bacterium]MDX9704130.1 thioredoxin family protein [Weeksellaceae bacterium]